MRNIALEAQLQAALNKLAKWRSVFTGWQIGTRPKGDATCDAIRDHREATMLLRAEVSALVGLLQAKGVFTEEEFARQLIDEAQHLDGVYQKRFPGFRSTDDGMTMDVHIARDTMAGWPP